MLFVLNCAAKVINDSVISILLCFTFSSPILLYFTDSGDFLNVKLCAFGNYMYLCKAIRIFMKNHLALLLLLFLAICCQERSDVRKALDVYEEALESQPLETYRLLTAIPQKYPSLSADDEARLGLLTIKAKNLADIPLVADDTIMVSQAIRFFQQQDVNNRVILGYYLLGSIYRDMGDAPQGLLAFSRALEVADTSRADCDYGTLARACGQKSNLQINQFAIRKALETEKQAEYYAWKARDTTYAFDIAFGNISHHSLLGDFNPLKTKALRLIRSCMAYGDTLMSVKYTISYAWYYLQLGMTAEADTMIQLYDRYNGNPYPIYYGTKGEWHLAHQRLDSAEHYFRKELEADDLNNRQAAYCGLKKLFVQRHLTDSALKYASLQCDAVDSDYQQKVTEDMLSLEQVFNYSHMQEAMYQQAMKSQRQWKVTVMVIFGFLALILLLLLFLTINRNRHLRMQKEKEVERRELEQKVAEEEKRRMRERERREAAEIQAARMEAELVEADFEMKNQLLQREQLEQEVMALQSKHQSNQSKIDAALELIRLKDEEIQSSKEDIQQKQQQLLAQQETIDNMLSSFEEYRLIATEYSKANDGIRPIQKCLERQKCATSEAWASLQVLILKQHPKFISELRRLVLPLLEQELRVSMLIKMGFKPREIATLTGHTPASITKTRRRIYEKAFGKIVDNTEVVDEWIRSI